MDGDMIAGLVDKGALGLVAWFVLTRLDARLSLLTDEVRKLGEAIRYGINK